MGSEVREVGLGIIEDLHFFLLLGSEDLHFSPASFSAQNFGKFSSDHHETPSSSIVANKDDLESRDNVLERLIFGAGGALIQKKNKEKEKGKGKEERREKRKKERGEFNLEDPMFLFNFHSFFQKIIK